MMMKTFLIIFYLLGNCCFCFSQSVNEGPVYDTIVDARDGKTYKTLKIGDQIWMAENLAYKPEKGICKAYNNNPENMLTFGYLYTWETAENICPDGWHLPSDDEWKQLETFAGMKEKELDIKGIRGKGIGTKLKSKHLWMFKGNGDDDLGFNALPAGYFYGSTYNLIYKYCFFWSSTKYSQEFAWYRGLHAKSSKIERDAFSGRAYGYSVRCIKD